MVVFLHAAPLLRYNRLLIFSYHGLEHCQVPFGFGKTLDATAFESCLVASVSDFRVLERLRISVSNLRHEV
jgi:hypothetical protein